MLRNIIKILVTVLILNTLSFGGLIDGVSITVNNIPITLYEIREYSSKLNLPVSKVVNILVREKIENALIKKYSLNADDLDVENEMEKIASNAGMSILDFKNYLQKKGVDLDTYKKDLAKKIAKQKLYKKVVSDKIKRVSDEEMKNYYKSHIELYSIPQMIEVIEYSSKEKPKLENLIKNPMQNINGVQIKNKVLKTNQINPKLFYILQQTKEGAFTPVISLKDGFLSFYIKRKINVKPIPFEKVKNTIFAKMMDEREKEIVKSYFDKLISEAEIKVIREPR